MFRARNRWFSPTQNSPASSPARNMSRLAGRQVEFFAAALGGPQPYTGAPMRAVHQVCGITEQILAAVTPLAKDIATSVA